MPSGPTRGILWGPMNSILLLAQVKALDAVPRLLAQVPGHTPVILAQDSAVSWPVLVTLLAVCTVIIESRVKIHRLEQDVADARKETAQVRDEHNKTAVIVSSMVGTLGEIRVNVAEMRKELREDMKARSNAA